VTYYYTDYGTGEDVLSNQSIPDFQIILQSGEIPQTLRNLTAEHVNQLIKVPGIVISCSKTRYVWLNLQAAVLYVHMYVCMYVCVTNPILIFYQVFKYKNVCMYVCKYVLKLTTEGLR
jgi:hypothetical protein